MCDNAQGVHQAVILTYACLPQEPLQLDFDLIMPSSSLLSLDLCGMLYWLFAQSPRH